MTRLLKPHQKHQPWIISAEEKGSHPKPIEDIGHYYRAFDYIHDHEERGAIVIVPEDPELQSSSELTEEDFLRDFGLME